jgi:BirA family biotin operon repressor/biotin-[acetyl-CoA-carboxylase] ligase
MFGCTDPVSGQDARPPLDESSVRTALTAGGTPWRRLDVVEQTSSTNRDLLARAAAGEPVDGVVLIAEHQTAGRGRMGRSWSAAPRSSITMSVGVGAGEVPIDAWGWLPLAAGVAVVDTVASTGVEAGLKWPNDVLAGDGKLAGILAEVSPHQPVVVVGIGLNITLRKDESNGLATSLAELGVAAPDRGALVCRLLENLGARVNGWRSAAGPDDRLLRDYRAFSITIGSHVRAVLPNQRELVGTAIDIDRQGRLCIDCGDRVIAMTAGDVVHLRPAADHGP